MYSKILVPLDGSKTAENVLPLARCFARSLQIPVELLAVVDIAEIARHASRRSSVDDPHLGRRHDPKIWRLFGTSCEKFSCRQSAMPGSARKCGRSDY